MDSLTVLKNSDDSDSTLEDRSMEEVAEISESESQKMSNDNDFLVPVIPSKEMSLQPDPGSTNGTCPQITIARPSSATLPSANRNNANRQRRFSSIARPATGTEGDNPFGTSGSYSRSSPRRSSVATFGSGSVGTATGKFLTPGSTSKDLEFVGNSAPPQHQRTRRISFGLGGVPKSGYWGVGGNVDNDSDSDDSLLAPASRKTSRTFKMSGPTLMGYNKRQWHYLIVFAIVDFCSALVISIQGPLFPREAEDKKVSATAYGLVFGVFELTILIMCPIFGKLLDKISPQSLFNGGIFTSGISVIMFGFLADVNDPSVFLTMSLFLRIIEAAGDAACMTAAYAVITAECPDTVSTTFIFLKTFFGVGFILGPLLSGILFTIGGFILPFVMLGGLLFCSALFTAFLLPKPISEVEKSESMSDASTLVDNANKGSSTTGFLVLLKSPTVLLAAYSIVASSISIGFLNATLEPHLREFTSSALTIGLIFILNGGVYSISSPVWGWGCHVVSDQKYIMLAGALLTFFAFLIIGPAPFIPIRTYFSVTCIGLVIQGLGIGATFVSGFLLALRDTVDKGYPDNDATYGLVSGLYTSLFALGNSIGPSGAGILVDNFGFRWATVFVLSCHGLLIFVVTCFILFDTICRYRRSRRRNSEFDDESYSALQLSETSQDECEWDESGKDFKDEIVTPNYGAIVPSRA